MAKLHYVIAFIALVFIYILIPDEVELFDTSHEFSSLKKMKESEVVTPDRQDVAENIAVLENLSISKKNIRKSPIPLKNTEFRYKDNKNLYSYALRLLEEAEAGNHEKQYELIFILNDCITHYSQDDSTYQESHSYAVAEIQNYWRSRCAGFNMDTFEAIGNTQDLLSKSANGGYAPAELHFLSFNSLANESIKETDYDLSLIKDAIGTGKFQSMQTLSSIIGRNNIINEQAWMLVSCDYGYDCSNTSKENWRYYHASDCEMNTDYNSDCNPEITYLEYLRINVTEEQYKEIIDKSEELKKIFKTGKLVSLTWEDILG